MQKPPTLDGAVALITGAAQGIGRQIALTFAAAGARVVAADIDSVGLADTASQAEGDLLAREVDMRAADGVSELVSATLDWGGRLDIVVNNAGMVHVDTLLDHEYDAWQRLFSVNVHGPFWLTREAARAMVAQPVHEALGRRGQFINVSSGAALIGRPLLPAYGASKAALNHLTMTTADSLRDQGIAASVLYPGNVREGMWRSVGADIARVLGRSEQEIEAERAFQPVEELADTALFLAARPGLELTGMAVHGPAAWGPLAERPAG